MPLESHSHRMIDIVGLSNELNVNNARVVNLEGKFIEINNKLTSVDNKINTADSKINNINATLNQVTTKVAGVKGDVETLGNKITGIDTKVSNSATKVTDLETRVAKIDTKVSNSATKVTDLETRVAKIDSNNSRIITDLSNINSNVMGLHDKIYVVEGKVSSLKPPSVILFSSHQKIETVLNVNDSFTAVCCIKIPANTFSTSSKGILKLSLKGDWKHDTYSYFWLPFELAFSTIPWDSKVTKVSGNLQSSESYNYDFPPAFVDWELTLEIETQLTNDSKLRFTKVNGVMGSTLIPDKFVTLTPSDVVQDMYLTFFAKPDSDKYPNPKLAIHSARLEKYPDYGEYIPK